MRALVLAVVFAAALLTLSYNVTQLGLAETYVDPLAKIPAQDEAVYSSTALHMAESGGWLTPMFLGRFAFYKPPVLYWAAGLSAKVLGPSTWALRLPSLLAAAGVATILFAWIWGTSPVWAAAAACVLLLTDRIFFSLSRLVLTDSILVLCLVVAMWNVHRSGPWWITGVASGVAIMTKGVAGFLPLMMLVGAGATVRQFLQVCAVAAAVAAPWHIYQLLVHTRWFWAEYILTEHFTWAVATPEQSTQENQLWYYGRRLWATDPVLVFAAVAGLPFAIRERNRLVAAWIGVVLLALVGFGYRNTSYLLLLIPALVFLAAPVLRYRAAAALVIAACLWKMGSLPYGPEHPLPSVAVLRSYAALGRPRDLIIVAPRDEFVSSTLNLHHVRYVFFDPNPNPYRLPLDFRYLGVTVTVPQFNELARWMPVFRERLAEFGLNSTDPVATVIVARSREEIPVLLAANPDSDFMIDGDLRLARDDSPARSRAPAPVRSGSLP